MWNANWGGYPDAEFLCQLDPKLGELRSRLPPKVHTIDRAVGGLTAEWAKRTGLDGGHSRGGRRVRRASRRASAAASRRARW